MKLSLCNEVLGDMPFEEQCRFVAALGYDGLEIAPFTLGAVPDELTPNLVRDTRRAAEAAGISITGLHWLMVEPKGLSITSSDPEIRQYTIDIGRQLVTLCADLDGSVLVHGSPQQRMLPEDTTGAVEARARALNYFAEMADAAASAGVIYCVEPLGPSETNFINTVAEAVELTDEISMPSLKTMIDAKAALQAEKQNVPDLLDRWLPTGKIAHLQLNDEDGAAPGLGPTEFDGIMGAIRRNGYTDTIAIEPFNYEPSPVAVAAYSVGYLRGLMAS